VWVHVTDWPRYALEDLERFNLQARRSACSPRAERAKAQSEKNRGLLQILRVDILPIFKLHVQYCIDQVVLSQWTSCRRRLRWRLGDAPSEKDVTVAKSHRRPHDKARESFALLLTRWSSGRDGNNASEWVRRSSVASRLGMVDVPGVVDVEAPQLVVPCVACSPRNTVAALWRRIV